MNIWTVAWLLLQNLQFVYEFDLQIEEWLWSDILAVPLWFTK